jgi:hypothetical protein
MLTNTKDLNGLVLRAVDGELGSVDEVYFDDQSWTVRYLTVDTDGWMGGRQVLISPMSVLGIDWHSKRVDVTLTKAQIEHSPDIDKHQPVSRQHEEAYLKYYGLPFYWDGPGAFYPAGVVPPVAAMTDEVSINLRRQLIDSHLRSSEEVSGYYIEANDGEIGHLANLILDDQTWAIRYLEVGTRNWWPGKKVLVSPAWVERVSWEESKVFVGMTRSAIEHCEEYVEGMPITRDYEDRIYAHYGRPPYWLKQQAESRLVEHTVTGI